MEQRIATGPTTPRSMCVANQCRIGPAVRSSDHRLRTEYASRSVMHARPTMPSAYPSPLSAERYSSSRTDQPQTRDESEEGRKNARNRNAERRRPRRSLPKRRDIPRACLSHFGGKKEKVTRSLATLRTPDRGESVISVTFSSAKISNTGKRRHIPATTRAPSNPPPGWPR